MRTGQVVVGGLLLTWWALFFGLVLVTVLSGAR
jgi:hypothetical protein